MLENMRWADEKARRLSERLAGTEPSPETEQLFGQLMRLRQLFVGSSASTPSDLFSGAASLSCDVQRVRHVIGRTATRHGGYTRRSCRHAIRKARHSQW
jgi:hypothetical protein